MEALAKEYAELKGTTLIKTRMEEDGRIVFVLESGQKHIMDAETLRNAIAAMKEVATPQVIDINDGVDKAEASAAGKALVRRRKTK